MASPIQMVISKGTIKSVIAEGLLKILTIDKVIETQIQKSANTLKSTAKFINKVESLLQKKKKLAGEKKGER